MYVHPDIYPMTSKNISITEKAYQVLRREKRGGESFTEAILRLTRRGGKLSDCYGSWKMTDEEQTEIQDALSRGWRRAEERINREMP